jgi:spermidine synthase
MYKYNGIVIHQSYDDDGVIEVVDDAGIRALHFGSEARQSTMSLAEPDKLLSRYARTMMGWQLFKNQADNLLMIGLGGGVLPKYFLNHFPDTQIKVIEYRRNVVKVAHSYFGLPLSPQLKIKIEDAAVYMRRQSVKHSAQHDLIMLDAFDHEGMAEVVTRAAFFDSCKTLLTDDGILVINSWGTNKPLFAQIIWNLQQTFSDNILSLPVRGRGNVIILVFNAVTPKLSLKELKNRASELESLYQLEFNDFVADLKKHNPYTFHRVVKI